MLHEGDGKKMSDKILEAYEKSVLKPKEEVNEVNPAKREEMNRRGRMAKYIQQINSVRSALDTLEKMIKTDMS